VMPTTITETVPKLTLARLTKAYCDRLKAKYKVLLGSVAEDNTVSAAWLLWLGFTLDTDNPIVVAGKRVFPAYWTGS